MPRKSIQYVSAIIYSFPQFGGIVKPFDEVCQLRGDLEADGYLEYDGLNNVSIDFKIYMYKCTCRCTKFLELTSDMSTCLCTCI